MSQVSRDFILKEDLKKIIWPLSWPAVLAMVLYGLNNFLDGVFVGRLLGNDALAAVGIVYPLSQISVGIGSLIGTGAGSILSIWMGAQEKSKLYKLTGSVNFISIIMTLLMAVPAYFFAEELVYMMGGRGKIALLAVDYYKATLFGTFFWIHGLSLNMMIRAEGKMKTAATLMGIGLLVDIILKPFFISSFGWGVEGAAWATNIAMFVYSVQGLFYYSSKYASFKNNWYSALYTREASNKIFSLGISSFIISLMMVIQSILIYNVLSKYGNNEDIAFYAAANRYFIFLLTPIFGLMRALQPVAGMNYGANQYQRAIDSFKLFLFVGTLILIPFFMIATFFPQQVLSMMMPQNRFSSSQLWDFRIYLGMVPLLPAVFLSMSYLPAIGNGRTAGVLSILRQVVFIIPAMIFLPPYFGISSIYWGTFLVDVITVSITYALVRVEFNKLRVFQSELRLAKPIST